MLFVKRGERVDAEAAALEMARHPGVVELAGVVDGALQTRRVDGRSLADVGPLAPDEVAGVAAAVATTLADLHELDVVHGGIEASHVLLGTDGRIVLCSLGRGGRPADDVAALGRLIDDLLATAPTAPQRPGAGRGGRRGWRTVPGDGGTRAGRGGWRVWQRTPGVGPGGAGDGRRGRRPARLGSLLAPPAGPVLAALAAEATAADPARRPGARALAAALHQQVPTARLPSLPAGGPVLDLPPAGARPADRRSRWSMAAEATRVVLLAGLAVVAPVVLVAPLVLGALWLAEDRGTGRTPPQLERAGTAGHPPTTGQPRDGATPVATPVDDPAGGRTGDARPAVSDPDADPVAERVWPVERLEFADGVLTVGGRRYAVGQPGDAVVAGDWRCTGERTVALLRPDTGEVFAFDGWAAPGEDVHARLVGRVEGAAGLDSADADGDGCDDLVAVRAGQPGVRLDGAAADRRPAGNEGG